MTLQRTAMALVPRTRSKYSLDLSYYSTTIWKLNDLTREVFTIYDYFKPRNAYRELEEVRPLVENVLSFWAHYYSTLKPLLEYGTENGRRLLSDQQYRKKVLARMLLNMPVIAVILQLALSLVFVYQCTQLWRIRSAIKEAIRFVSEDEVKLEFSRIEQNLEHLKDISSDLQMLVDQYEKCRNPKEVSRLLEKINTKLIIAKRFADTSEVIDNLQAKLQAQKIMLTQCDQRFIQTGLTSLSASGIGLLTVLINDKLTDIEQNLITLADNLHLDYHAVEQLINETEKRKELLFEERLKEETEALKTESGMIASLLNVAGGWRTMASSYMKIL